MRWIFFVVFLFPLSLKAVDAPQPIVVPRVVRFAGMRLKFTRGAYKRVQEKVNQLTRSQRSFNQILERTHLFFPLIERILADENVPDDFKFQAVHESTLIGNAVSHTHDVGFWQIQKATGLGLKLTIDSVVDERMHLIESTKAAARFLKPHNQYFDSWLGALLAYNRGRAGAVKIFPKKWYGVKTVRLDDKTDNYIISVIATKIAFAKVAGKEKHPKMQLFLYTEGHHGQRLGDIATHLKIEEKLLYEHNQWLRTAVVPHNTKCCLVVPFLHTHAHMHAVLKQTKPLKMALPAKQPTGPTTEQPIQLHHVNYGKYLKAAQKNLVITAAHNAASTRLIKANGKMAVVAKEGDTIADLAKLGKIDLEKFLVINEVKKNDGLIPGAIYYFNLKSSKGGAHYHVVASGEGIWDIAQRYGMKQAALLEKNRMSQSEPLDTGRILWLRFIRPRKIPVEYYDVGSL